MKFVGKDPTKEDTSSPQNMVKFFLEANLKFPTEYKSGGPVHYPGRFRSVCELVEYGGQYGFTREQLLPEIPKQTSVFYCYEIRKYVMDPSMSFYVGDLADTKYSRNLAREMGINID